jgi:hypothetical protein
MGDRKKRLTITKITLAGFSEPNFPKVDRNGLFLKSQCLYIMQNHSIVVGSVDSGAKVAQI